MIDSKKVIKSIAAHEKCKARIREAILHGAGGFKPESVAPSNACELAQLLQSDQQIVKDSNFPKIQKVHNELHKEAGHIFLAALQGKSVEAEKMLGVGSKFAKLSEELESLLRSLIPLY